MTRFTNHLAAVSAAIVITVLSLQAVTAVPLADTTVMVAPAIA